MIAWEQMSGWKIWQTAEMEPCAGPQPWQVTELCQSKQGLIKMDKPAGAEGNMQGGEKAEVSTAGWAVGRLSGCTEPSKCFLPPL